jgi:hypothetical protein
LDRCRHPAVALGAIDRLRNSIFLFIAALVLGAFSARRFEKIMIVQHEKKGTVIVWEPP